MHTEYTAEDDAYATPAEAPRQLCKVPRMCAALAGYAAPRLSVARKPGGHSAAAAGLQPPLG